MMWVLAAYVIVLGLAIAILLWLVISSFIRNRPDRLPNRPNPKPASKALGEYLDARRKLAESPTYTDIYWTRLAVFKEKRQLLFEERFPDRLKTLGGEGNPTRMSSGMKHGQDNTLLPPEWIIERGDVQ